MCSNTEQVVKIFRREAASQVGGFFTGKANVTPASRLPVAYNRPCRLCNEGPARFRALVLYVVCKHTRRGIWGTSLQRVRAEPSGPFSVDATDAVSR